MTLIIHQNWTNHCNKLWSPVDNEGLGHIPTFEYPVGINANCKNKTFIRKYHLISKILSLWIFSSVRPTDKRNPRDLEYNYISHSKQDGASLFFLVYKYMKTETIMVTSYIKHNIEVANMENFRHNDKDANHKLSEWMEKSTRPVVLMKKLYAIKSTSTTTPHASNFVIT